MGPNMMWNRIGNFTQAHDEDATYEYMLYRKLKSNWTGELEPYRHSTWSRIEYPNWNQIETRFHIELKSGRNLNEKRTEI